MVAEVSLWPPDPPEFSSLGAIFKRISYIRNRVVIYESTPYLLLGFLFAPATSFGFPESLIGWTFDTSTTSTTASARSFFMV